MKKAGIMLFVIWVLPLLCFAQGVATYNVTRQTGISFTSIMASGTSIPVWRSGINETNNRSMPVALGFTFNYLGTPYTQISACTNGFVDFSASTANGNTPGAYSNDNSTFSLPAPNGTLLTLAPFYEDIMCGLGATLATSIKYLASGTTGSKVFTVEWNNMTFPGAYTNHVTFQVKIYEADARIEFIYGLMSVSGLSLSYTCGINSAVMSTPPQAAELLTQEYANSANFGPSPRNDLDTLPETNSKIIFTGCPLPFSAGVISGPASICENSFGVVFSVAPIGYATGYNWILPAGYSFASGVNTPSITVDIATGASTGNIQVAGTNTCGNGTNSLKLVAINQRPAVTLSGPAAACIDSSGNIYTTQPGNNNYQWAISAGGILTAGGTTTSNTATIKWTNTGTQTVQVNYTNGNGCTGNLPAVLHVVVNSLPIITINGPAIICASTAGQVYTTEPGMTNYTWTISSGGTITAGGGTNSITVTWNNPGFQTVSVNYSNLNGCRAAAPWVKNVTVNPRPVPTISGLSAVCAGTTGVMYTTEAMMSGYNWSISSGGTITSGLGNDTITVTWNNAGAQQVYVNYTNVNGCLAANPTAKSVSVNPLPVPAIAGNVTPCANSGNYPYNTESGMTSYLWTLSPGGIITSGQGTHQVNVNWIGTGLQWICVDYTSSYGCDAITPTTDTIVVNPLPGAAGNVSGQQVFCGAASGIPYSILAVLNASEYIWTLPAGAVIATGSGTQSITVNYPANSSPGEIIVMANNLCGAGAPSPPLPIQFTPVPETPVISQAGDLLISSVADYNQWYLNGIPIPGASEQYYPATDTGLYWDLASVNNCASDTSNHIYVSVITGLKEQSRSKRLLIYPVPSDGMVTLEMNDLPSGKVELCVFSNTGIRVYHDLFLTKTGKVVKYINLPSVSKGVYTVRVNGGSWQETGKVVKW